MMMAAREDAREGSIPVDSLPRRIDLLRDRVSGARAALRDATRIPDAIAEALIEADVYRLLLPEDLGGAGIDPWQQLEIVERIAQEDASVAWNIAVGSGLGLFAGYLPPNVAQSIFATARACIAGSGAPQGTAERIDGGYRVNGRFSWASGIDQAQWAYGGCFVTKRGEKIVREDGTPEIVAVVAPIYMATVHDNWDVSGLIATGSKDFSLDDVFVPADHSFGAVAPTAQHPAPIFRLPTTIFGFALSGVPLGVASAALEALRALGTAKSTAGGLRDRESVQFALARSEAMIEAARANLRAAFAGIWEPVLAGVQPAMSARARLRRAIVLTAENCTEAVTQCYRAAGGSALFRSYGFERALRDIHALGGHLVFQRAMMEDAGRVGFGLDPRIAIF